MVSKGTNRRYAYVRLYGVKSNRLNLYLEHFGSFNPLNAELNPICPLLALFQAHHILHVSR